MALELGARAHAFLHGLTRPSEAAETEAVYRRAFSRFRELELHDEPGRAALTSALAHAVVDRAGIPRDHEQARVVRRLIGSLLDYDQLFVLPEVESWSQKRTIAQWWELRDELSRQVALVVDFDDACESVIGTAFIIVASLLEACPALVASADADGLTIRTSLLRHIADLGGTTETMLTPFFGEDAVGAAVFPRLRSRLERNIIRASGGNPDDPSGFSKAPRLPTQSDAREPEVLVETYLAGTPMLGLFAQDVDFVLETERRFEHHHIVAGSGHGKTQTLQYLIGHDLEAVANGSRSIVVLDSQGDLIRRIAELEVFAPGARLHERLVLIDPTDVEWPVSLNLFDVGMDRLSGYAPLERERLTNSILELYDFVLGTLLSAEMTQKQNVIFRYVTRLMLHIPDATIHTLRELMEPGSQVKFAEHIEKLSGSARHFFETEFASKEFEQTKKQVLRRLWGILENQTFERMFSHPRSKLDLFAEMNAGKVILINTAKDLLKEQGTEIFGRFFIALIAQAAQERATLPEHARTPTIVYIDEAQDYFDRNIGLILAQARKYNVGMVLAHQYLGQLDPKLQDAIAANTAIKFAGGVSAKDARAFAPMLYCSPELIEAQPKGAFAAHVRGQTKGAVPLAFPFGYMEALPRMSAVERAAVRKRMREHYAVHHTELDHSRQASGGGGAATPPPGDLPADRPAGHIDTDASDSW